MLRWIKRGWRRVARRVELVRPRFAFELIKFGNDDAPYWALCLLGSFVRLWMSRTSLVDTDGMLDRYGVHYSGCLQDVVVSWGAKYRRVPMPWQHRRLLHEDLLASGHWRKLQWLTGWLSWRGPRYKNRRVESWEIEDGAASDTVQPLEPSAPRWTAQYPFAYTLRNGTQQQTTATVTKVDRSSCSMALFVWLRWPLTLRRRTSIWLEFADELGSERGSWKGGTTGAGGTLQHGEAIADAVRRFEREWSQAHRFCKH